MTSKTNNSELTMVLNLEIAHLSTSVMKKGFLKTSLLLTHLNKMTEAVATTCYTQNRSTIVKRNLKTPYEIFHKRIPNISFLHVFGCLVYIHNHKDHLGKFDEKADDDYLLGYSLVSKAFIVLNIRRQQTEETYHITFDESPEAIKFSKPSVNNINIAESERYPLDEYLHPYEPSQRYQTNNNDVSFIEPYKCPEPVVLETKISEHLSSPNMEDTLAKNTTIPSLPLHVPSMVTPAPQDRWSQDKHIELVNIIDFLSEEEPKKVSEALKHPGWVDAMQDELNQFARNKVWTLVPTPYGKTIIGSRWQEGIHYDETFAPVARLEAIKIFLAFATDVSLVWKLIDTPYRAMWDTAYWGFLGVRTTSDIFQNILLLYCEYGILMSPGYGVLGLQSFVVICEV
ncbi:retrovirus-related pol polyprotein from transposon TNT 1-94 [Tanacetum coccineum]